MVFTTEEYRGLTILISRCVEKGLLQPNELVAVGTIYNKAAAEGERENNSIDFEDLKAGIEAAGGSVEEAGAKAADE